MKAKVKTWIENIENGKFKSYSEKVLKEIKDNTSEYNGTYLDSLKKGISTYQLRRRLGMAHQTLTSRLSELNDEGLIKVVGQVETEGTTYSVYQYVLDTLEIEAIVLLRRKEKYVIWLKKADSFTSLMGFKTVDMIHQEQVENNCY